MGSTDPFLITQPYGMPSMVPGVRSFRYKSVGGDSVVMKVGTHQLIKQSVGIAMSSPLAALISITVNAIALSLDEGESIDQYFYFSGNASNGYSYTKHTGLPGQLMDLYEIQESKKGVEFVRKVYLRTNRSISALFSKFINLKLAVDGLLCICFVLTNI